MSRTQGIVGAMAALLAVGCSAQLGTDGEALSHDQAEMRVTVGELREGWRAEGQWLVSPPLMAPDGASRVGVLLGLSAPGAMPALEARPMAGGTPAGEWVRVRPTWSEEDHHVGVAELGGVADGAQLRIAASAAEGLEQLRWNAVIPSEPELAEEAGDADLGARREALRSELRGLGIVTREAWGARRTRCSSRDASKTKMAIHYTVTPSQNPERQVRGIQRYHMDSRGWCDVGYHFLVGVDGTIYEGRPLHLRGAHVGGHNSRNIGIAFVGCFNSSGCRSSWGPRHPPEAMIEAGARLVGALGDVYGIAVDRSRVRGHREHPGQSTSCPGDHLLARLDEMVALAGSGPVESPDPAPAPPTGGDSCTHSYGGTYADTACSAGWQCCDGSWRSRGSCGGCLCVEESGRTGCTAPSEPAPAPTEPPPGDSCTHSYGGTYANTACSAGWQCCDGSWRSRGSCGACFCVEESGAAGCGAEPAGPPPGASCGHSYGGTYSNTACSAGWQCCDGSWQSRGACGTCYCVEESGTTGC